MAAPLSFVPRESELKFSLSRPLSACHGRASLLGPPFRRYSPIQAPRLRSLILFSSLCSGWSDGSCRMIYESTHIQASRPCSHMPGPEATPVLEGIPQPMIRQSAAGLRTTIEFCTYLSLSVYKAARAGPWSRGCAQATRTQELIGPQAHADNPRIHELPMTRYPHGGPTSKSVV